MLLFFTVPHNRHELCTGAIWHKSRFYTIFVIGKVRAKINIYLINAKLSQALNVRDFNRPSL